MGKKRPQPESLPQGVEQLRKRLETDASAQDILSGGMAADYVMLKALVENLPCLIYIKDRQSRFLLCNAASVRIMGATCPEELLGKTDHLYYPKALADEFRADEVRIMETGTPMVNKDEPTVQPDGEKHWIMTTKLPLRNRAGEIIGIMGIGHDITERKRLEHERDKLIRELKDALASVDTLNRLLPICAACKKIRDDEGYWHQVESYIRDHSNAQFSHGICPECARTLYPEYYHEPRTEPGDPPGKPSST